jgi:hypothetical protein
MKAAGTDKEWLKRAVAFLRGYEAVLLDRRYQAFIDVWHQQDLAKRPKRKRGRPKGVTKYDDISDKIEQHPHLSDRELAVLIDPRPHNQEAIRKAVERARASGHRNVPARPAKAELRIEKLANEVKWPVALVSLLVDEEGWIRPARESLESLQAMIANLEADLGQETPRPPE